MMADGWPPEDSCRDAGVELYAALNRLYRFERGLSPDNQGAAYEQAEAALKAAFGKQAISEGEG